MVIGVEKEPTMVVQIGNRIRNGGVLFDWSDKGNSCGNRE